MSKTKPAPKKIVKKKFAHTITLTLEERILWNTFSKGAMFRVQTRCAALDISYDLGSKDVAIVTETGRIIDVLNDLRRREVAFGEF